MSEAFDDALLQGLQELGVAGFSDDILQYFQLLKRWNKAYNLIAPADDLTLYGRHVFDSLSVRNYVTGPRCLDVGTGAGLPGLLLAVTMPDQEWTLLDAIGKKTRFCEQAVLELGLKNVSVVQQRIEHHQPTDCYQTIISRAYDQAGDFVSSTSRLMCDDGQILAMKGKIDAEEKSVAESTGLHLDIATLHVPGIDGQRHLMMFK